ncbi:hypothetical protein [Pseudomonas putida]
MAAMHYMLSAGLLCVTLGAQAQTVLRCEGEDGHLTFTTQQCPSGTLQSLQQAYHPFLSSESERTAAKECAERKQLDAELKRQHEDL